MNKGFRFINLYKLVEFYRVEAEAARVAALPKNPVFPQVGFSNSQISAMDEMMEYTPK